MAKPVKTSLGEQEPEPKTVETATIEPPQVKTQAPVANKRVTIIDNPYLTDEQKSILISEGKKPFIEKIKAHDGWTLVTFKVADRGEAYLINVDPEPVRALYEFLKENKAIIGPTQLFDIVLKPYATANRLDIKKITQITLD